MKKSFVVGIVALVLSSSVLAQKIVEFKTDTPELIGTWSFEASHAEREIPYQMALWAPDVTSYSTLPEGVLTWYTCRTIIKISKISKAKLPEYKITDDAEILQNYEFYQINDNGSFRIGYCSNRLGDQWPEYILREIKSGKLFIAGHLISQARIQELLAMDKKNPYQASVFETSRRQSGKAEFKIFSEIKRARIDYNTSPALEYAEEQLGYADEIQHVRHVLKDPAVVYNSTYVNQQKVAELKPYLPFQPKQIVVVATSRWFNRVNGEMYTAIANGEYKGFGPGKAFNFYWGYVSLIQGYGHYCKSEVMKQEAKSVNYDWVESNEWGETDREKVFDEAILMNERYASSFDKAFRNSRKVKISTAMMDPGVLAQMVFDEAELRKKISYSSFELIDQEDCNSPELLQLLENYHRKLESNSPYIQEVEKRMKAL